jgi:hypothetical protein
MFKPTDPTYYSVFNAIVTETLHIPFLSVHGLPRHLNGDIFVQQMSQIEIDIRAQIVRVDKSKVVDLAMEKVELCGKSKGQLASTKTLEKFIRTFVISLLIFLDSNKLVITIQH